MLCVKKNYDDAKVKRIVYAIHKHIMRYIQQEIFQRGYLNHVRYLKEILFELVWYLLHL